MSNILNEIKMLLIHNDLTMTELLNSLNENNNRNEAPSNFHRKLNNETIKYSEIKDIADILDYDLVWVPRTTKIDTHNNGIMYATASTRLDYKQSE
jgi:hypothetical protein